LTKVNKDGLRVIGQNIRVLRQRLAFTQKELANHLNLSRQTVCMLELGQAQPNVTTLYEVADFFGLSLDSLLVSMAENYCVFTCDVTNSRTSTDRKKLQNKVTKIVKTLNKTFEKKLVTRFNITLGDEFQGVFTAPFGFLEMFLNIKAGLLPHGVRIGVGVGEIHTRIYKSTSHKMDGPAFHFARDMMDKAKKDGAEFYLKTSKAFDEIVNLLLLEALKPLNNATQVQLKVLATYARLNNQLQVAEEIGVSQANVSNILNRFRFYQMKQIFEQIQNMLIQTHKFNL
jgi:transcriptional regulator with XRE-family HTH domain